MVASGDQFNNGGPTISPTNSDIFLRHPEQIFFQILGVARTKGLRLEMTATPAIHPH